jgi:sugar (pentulose or hexulose) kinase
MTEKTHILAIDNGTQSVRALLFDLKGNLETKVQIKLEPYFSEHPGWAEQHAEVFWDALCKACQALWEQSRVSRDAVAGVAVTTQRGCVINLDKDGNPLRPMISWLDQRRADAVEPIGGEMGDFFKAIGATDAIRDVQVESEANWIASNQPEIWGKTDKYLLLSGYHTYKLTGEFKDSVGAQVGFIPFDYRNLGWCESTEWQWQIAPIKREMLPDLVPPGDLLGNITAEAAAATGIPEGLPLIAAGTDKGCEILGAGCMEKNVGCLSYGTTATINILTADYLESSPMVPPWPAPIPAAYNIEEMIYRGYWMVDWFKNQFALREQQIADKQGIEPETLFDDLVNEVPPGSMGLMLQPYWTPGRNMPEAKGAIIGFGDVHTRTHIYRAILEGLAYGLREGLERIEKASQVTIEKLIVAGGGAQSDAAMQLTADIFGLPTARPHVYETSGLGAAIDAAVGLSLFPDFESAIKEMTHTATVFQPNPENREIYDNLYRRVYLKMYPQLQPLYQEIRDITGYPAKN